MDWSHRLKICFTDDPQLAQEIESQAVSAQREINVVKGAVAAKQRDVRMLELTTKELNGLSKDTNVYEGVGKMFVHWSCSPQRPY